MTKPGSTRAESGERRRSSARPTRPPSRGEMLAQFTNVVLARPYGFGEHALPKGASGTIVSVFPDTRSYTVEFFEPRHCVISVQHDGLESDSKRG